MAPGCTQRRQATQTGAWRLPRMAARLRPFPLHLLPTRSLTRFRQITASFWSLIASAVRPSRSSGLYPCLPEFLAVSALLPAHAEHGHPTVGTSCSALD